MKVRAFLRRILVGAICLASCFLLAACSGKPGAPLTLDQLRAKYIDQLQHYGAQVVVLGETVKIIFPSDNLFNYDSANLYYQGVCNLKVAAKLIRTYDKVTITVQGFDDDVVRAMGPVNRKLALTVAQAQTVSKFLYRRGVNARLLVAEGFGARHPVDWNGKSEGTFANRRLEITFQFYPVPTVDN